ncbi:MAG: hypothetical protein M3O30_14475 [Planctomycetota bacterium]|nr:hypothetical protein [Planctomycetota bacterium]
MAVALMCGLASLPARAADDAVAPFVDTLTDAVIHVDMTSVNIDAISAMYQKAMDQSTMAQAQKDQATQQMQKQLPVAKEWIANFTKAGGKDLYVVVSIRGLMAQQPGEIVVPLGAGADADALAKAFKPGGNAPANPQNAAAAAGETTTAVVGKCLVFCQNGELARLQSVATAPAPAHSDLLDALGSTGSGSVHIAVGGVGLQIAGTQLASLTGMRPNQQMSNLSWAALGCSLPPTESLSLTMNCKTPEAAALMLSSLNKQIDQMRNDPQSIKRLGDQTNKLADALKPAADGTKITMSLDQSTIDGVLPVIMKNSQPIQTPVPMSNGGGGMPQN